MVIPFGTHFCEKHLEEYLTNYWIESHKEENYEIIFDLSILEWINIEEITFLFSWIRLLKQNRKKINVVLPIPRNITKTNEISNLILQIYKDDVINDNIKRVERRERLNIFLLSIWKMLTRVGLNDQDFQNILEGYNKIDDKLHYTKFSEKVIPFTVLDSSHNLEEKVKVDNVFENALNGMYSKTTNQDENNSYSYDKLFHLSEEIITFLVKHKCFSPFESKIISHVITKELFINSIEHSGSDECYFSIALRNKWENPYGNKFHNSFIEEKDEDTLDFYKDKIQIFNKIKETLKENKYNIEKDFKVREADLSNFNTFFRNISYVEFSYLDYGQGIYSTLQPEFEKNQENIKSLLSESSLNQHVHSQILEYAFLMESSKNPYDRNIEYSELIPRGLYFLIDMVRRFKGMIIARSGYGKVIYDFSDKIYIKKSENQIVAIKDRIYQAKEAIRINKRDSAFFDGTIVSIILPERDIEDLALSPVRIDNKILNHYIFNLNDASEISPKEFFDSERVEYLSMVFLHQEALISLSHEELNTKNSLENFIFQRIDKKLTELKGIKSLLFIDFEFLFERSNYIKIITWLTNTPKVNEFTKVVIFNLTKDESSVLKIIKENFYHKEIYSSTDFLFKPIPCISLKKMVGESVTKQDVTWVGIRSETDEALLTNLLLGVKDSYDVSYFENKYVSEGHLVSKFQDKVSSNLSSISSIIDSFKNSKEQFIGEWIINREINNGEITSKDEEKKIFLTSRGTYQREYISLYETLHNKYITKLFAKLLIDKFIEKQLGLGFAIEDITIDKIIVVTVCSQLIGVAIRDLIRDSKEYKFLYSKKESINSQVEPPKLIRLASYFSFKSEKPFEDIEINDKVIIVNDVISTGALIERLIDGIKNKKAEIKSIMTIVDSRFDETSSSNDETAPVFFSDHYEKNIITSILSSKYENRLRIKKFKKKPTGSYKTKRINPILNTVIGLKHTHSEKDRVLFKDLSEFTNESFSRNEIFKIGHFKQGLTHNGFYTDMKKLFLDENGKEVLQALKWKIEKNINELKLSKHEIDKVFLKNALNNINNIDAKWKFKPELFQSDIKNIKESISTLLNKFEETKEDLDLEYFKYSPDFIFFPIFSGIEIVTDNTFHEVFGTEIDNIISLQRYETRNGWRFPFPAKRYNKLTKGKHILIVDSGSLTGDSLVQLIDSISFLEVGRIDFLSIIGRLDDFQREFYSRLKSIKVKNFSQGKIENKEIDTIINLNLLFGINIHIPPYGSHLACPFCKETDELNIFKDKFKDKTLPVRVEDYILNRLDSEIKLMELKQEHITPSYLPLIKEIEPQLPDFKNIFIMRDKLGKVDSYRFYEEYFEPFNLNISNLDNGIFEDKTTLKDFELILICILHEPTLYGVVKDLLANVYEIINYIIDSIVFNKTATIHEFYYKWSEYSIVRLAVIFKEDRLYTFNSINSLLIFSKNDEDGLNYLSFLLTKGFLGYQSSSVAIEEIPNIMNQLFDSTKNNKDVIHRLVREITRIYEKTEVKNVVDAFSNLNKFFIREGSVNSHSALENLFSSLNRNTLNPKLIEEKKEQIYNDLSDIKNSINDNIYTNLVKIKETEYLKNCYEIEYNRFFNGNSVYAEISTLFKGFDQLDETNTNYLCELELLSKKFSDFQFKYLINGDSKLQSFIGFCREYGANLNQCVTNALKSPEVKKEAEHLDNFVVDVSFLSDEIILNMHTKILINSFIEVFKNAAKFAKNNKDKSVRVSIEITSSDSKKELKIIQNQPFDNPNKICRGTKNIIETAFVTFYGSENFKVNHTPLYEIIVTLN